MKSIYEQALGDDFEKLHPKIQERFGFRSEDNKAAIGRGVMEEVWHGAFYTLPFLWVGAFRRIMFPERGRDIEFSISNYAYKDQFGRETVTWVRQFKTKRNRRFDAYMIFSPARGIIVDYLGSHQHLAVDLHLSVAENGGMMISSGEQRFYEGVLSFRFPLAFSGVAQVTEWFDEERGQFGIRVAVSNRLWGQLFGYSGYFDVEWVDMNGREVPTAIKPLREEKRE